jgi:16S rRNA (guanine966-N2)-methyltransferase
VRVIGGKSRGRRLPAHLPGGVRPTSDRVREAVFDMLGSLGAVEGSSVLDLFCGSGALGVEALSRGARSVTFVDRDPRALRAVRSNLAGVGLGHEPARLVRATLPRWLEETARGGFDVVLCDPPYAFGGWERLLRAVRADVAVFESGEELAIGPPWVVARSRRYGGTLVTVAQRSTTGTDSNTGSNTGSTTGSGHASASSS